jgi:XTP/dITP diphosphohydrolase
VLNGPAGPGGPAPGRLILLVTSPRVAPGLLSWPAWEALRGAARVLAGAAGHPQLPALADAGVQYEIMASGPDPVVPAEQARLLAEAAAQADGPVVWLAGNGGSGRPGAAEEAAALATAVRDRPGGGPETTVLAGSADVPGARLLDLVTTMEVLRAECPWDAKQTHESLAPHLLEEPYEALEALENGDYGSLREELGDVLLQVIFHAKVASERDDGTGFSVDDVADGIVTKLVRRHPHVFADVAVSGADEVKRNWDAIKKAERAERALPGDAPSSVLDGVPFGQPALALAAQLQRRAARAGVPNELLAADSHPEADREPAADSEKDPVVAGIGADLGDRLFALVSAARAADLDPEMELRAAARRYSDRVRAWEQRQLEMVPDKTNSPPAQ